MTQFTTDDIDATDQRLEAAAQFAQIMLALAQQLSNKELPFSTAKRAAFRPIWDALKALTTDLLATTVADDKARPFTMDDGAAAELVINPPAALGLLAHITNAHAYLGHIRRGADPDPLTARIADLTPDDWAAIRHTLDAHLAAAHATAQQLP